MRALNAFVNPGSKKLNADQYKRKKVMPEGFAQLADSCICIYNK